MDVLGSIHDLGISCRVLLPETSGHAGFTSGKGSISRLRFRTIVLQRLGSMEEVNRGEEYRIGEVDGLAAGMWHFVDIAEVDVGQSVNGAIQIQVGGVRERCEDGVVVDGRLPW